MSDVEPLGSRVPAGRLKDVVVGRRRTLVAWVRWSETGGLVFSGQDLGGCPSAGEYEYAISVPASEGPKVKKAVGITDDDELLRALVDDGDRILATGERTWLVALGAEVEVWSRVD